MICSSCATLVALAIGAVMLGRVGIAFAGFTPLLQRTPRSLDRFDHGPVLGAETLIGILGVLMRPLSCACTATCPPQRLASVTAASISSRPAGRGNVRAGEHARARHGAGVDRAAQFDIHKRPRRTHVAHCGETGQLRHAGVVRTPESGTRRRRLDELVLLVDAWNSSSQTPCAPTARQHRITYSPIPSRYLAKPPSRASVSGRQPTAAGPFRRTYAPWIDRLGAAVRFAEWPCHTLPL
jgi:hypothetical protein